MHVFLGRESQSARETKLRCCWWLRKRGWKHDKPDSCHGHRRNIGPSAHPAQQFSTHLIGTKPSLPIPWLSVCVNKQIFTRAGLVGLISEWWGLTSVCSWVLHREAEGERQGGTNHTGMLLCMSWRRYRKMLRRNKNQQTSENGRILFSDEDSLFLKQSDKSSMKCNGHYEL